MHGTIIFQFCDRKKKHIKMKKIISSSSSSSFSSSSSSSSDDDELSLCDLPIYNKSSSSSSSSEWGDFMSSGSSSSVSSSSSSSDQFFEFFTEEWRNNNKGFANDHPQENIIFCGKLIIPQHDPRKRRPNKQIKEKPKVPRKGSSSRNDNNGELSEPYWPKRSRWFVFLFGVGGLPKEMDLKCIKNRQMSRGRTPPSQGGRGKRLWWTIQALSCGGSGRAATTQVNAQAIVRQGLYCLPKLS